MLATLRNLDRRTRDGVLASYMQKLLPDPGIEESSSEDPYSEIFERLKAELLRELRLRSLDTPEARQQALRYLSHQVRANVIDSKKIRDIRERVGQKGALPLSAYQIKYAESFRQASETVGVRKSMIEAAIKAPDDVEHLLPEAFGQDSDAAISLITKTFRSADPYVLVIFAMRKKTDLNINAAWMVFHSDVELSGAKRATEVLRRFVDKYGIDIMVDGQKERFVLYRSFVIRPGEHNNILKLEHSEQKAFESQFVVRQSAGKVEIACAFALDTEPYIDSLRKHGVQITRK